MSAASRFASKSLKNKLIDIIRLRGPITVADYMKIVLTNPESGFYMNNDVFGVKGHFTTSPEISQTFGEILGAWILQEWARFGCQRPLKLVEFGPGRGTLMSDITRTIGQLDKDLIGDLRINMIEMSPKLKAMQKETLSKRSTDLIKRTEWFSHIDALPTPTELEQTKSTVTTTNNVGFTAFIAHEYLDALPIFKFVRDPKTNAWRDLVIDYDSEENLRFSIASQPSLMTRLLIPEDFTGDLIEVGAEGAVQMEKVARHLEANKQGCMLVCDYGFDNNDANSLESSEHPRTQAQDISNPLKPFRSDRDTFRAFRNHEAWPPLKDPGEADLTADVDFGYLRRHLSDKCVLFGSTTQREFLLKCGLQVRLKSLLDQWSSDELSCDNSADKRRRDLMSGADLMLNSMGARYRFLAMFPKGTEHMFINNPPAGFATTNTTNTAAASTCSTCSTCDDNNQ